MARLNALAMPAVELLLAAQTAQKKANQEQREVLFGRRVNSCLDAMHLGLRQRCAQYDTWRARSILQLTAAANDELAAPAQA